MRVFKLTVGVSLACLLATVALAQEPPAAPQPTAEHKALEMWVGSWVGQGEMKPGPFGPGGPMSWTEECSWFGGNRFNVVCKSEGTGPMGPSQGLGIIGYNPEKKVYMHYGIDSTGWMGHSEGSRSGDDWTFQSEETMGGKTYHTRFTMSWTSPKAMKFSWEMSEDGESWTVVMDGTTTKK